MTALIVFAHGSSVEPANDAVRQVSAELARQGGYGLVRTAFLGGGEPELADAVDEVVEAGAGRIIVLPYFLTLGLHLQRDLPNLVAAARRRHPGCIIEVTPPLDGHAGLVRILLDRARTALQTQS
jgi:sirohydrochlorin ferrochelatase